MSYGHGSPNKELKTGKKPLQPVVTMEQIVAFDPARPETATPSPLMNQILGAMHAVRPISSTTLGKYLEISPKELCIAVKLLTGIPYSDVRETWAKRRVETLRAEHPDWTLDQLARAVGYADHTALWRTDHRSKRREEYREKKCYGEILSAQRAREWAEMRARMAGEEKPPIDTNGHETR